MRKVIRFIYKGIFAVIFAGYKFILYKISDKRSILFNVVRENHFLMFEPLYERLRQDRRLKIFFTSSWKIHGNGQTPTDILLGKYNIPPEHIISHDRAYWQPWDICVEVDYKVARTLWPSKKIQMFHGFSGKYRDGGRDGTLHQSISKFDALFCFSRIHEQMFKNSGHLKKNCRTFCIGFPKLDKIICPEPTREMVLRDYGANPDKQSILYAPSWNPQLSLNNIGQDLIELLGQSDWTLMVKPHPMSLQTFGDMPGYKRRDWHQYLTGLHQKGRIIYITDQNACRYLKAADILITDHGSTLYEYMILNRPILYYDTAEAQSIMTIPQYLPKVRRVVLPFQTAQEALDILKQERWKGRSNETDIRRELIEFRFYDIGRAANRAVEAMYSLLKLNPIPEGDKKNA